MSENDDLAGALPDNIPGLVAYWGADLRCRLANRAYCQWTGKQPAEILGRARLEVIDPNLASVVLPRVRDVLLGTPQIFDLAATKHGESQVSSLRVFYTPDFDGASVRGFFVFAIDLSEDRSFEERLRRVSADLASARDRAEAADREKSIFLANLTHEIRTPMNAIVGLSHLLRRDNPTGATAERLMRIQEAALHLMGVVDGILDLAKIEAGKLVLEEVEFALDTVLMRAFAVVIDTARAKGLELVIDTDHVPLMLLGDPTRLSQGLVNLLGNAIKFTAAGHVSLIASVVHENESSVLLRFEITDSGRGIPAKELKELFVPFGQVQGTVSRGSGGTGLGLVITRHLASLMGGDAGARSVEGVGSTFWMTAALRRGATSSRLHEGAFAGVSALLVDDLQVARAGIGQMLRRMGVRTDIVGSASDALRLCDDPKIKVFDIVLADSRMPTMGGVELIDQLKGRRSVRTPRFILLSANGDDRAPEGTLLLPKPVSYSSLNEALTRMLLGDQIVPKHESLALQIERDLRERHSGKRVLVAEDNPVNQDVAKSVIEIAGLSVSIASDGQQAIDLASGDDYALVLMDMEMPVLGGLEATAELRKRGYTRPIIAMTANAYTAERDACLQAGMNDFLTKPVNPALLYAVLTKWLD